MKQKPRTRGGIQLSKETTTVEDDIKNSRLLDDRSKSSKLILQFLEVFGESGRRIDVEEYRSQIEEVLSDDRLQSPTIVGVDTVSNGVIFVDGTGRVGMFGLYDGDLMILSEERTFSKARRTLEFGGRWFN
jgi:hypothetical protein